MPRVPRRTALESTAIGREHAAAWASILKGRRQEMRLGIRSTPVRSVRGCALNGPLALSGWRLPSKKATQIPLRHATRQRPKKHDELHLGTSRGRQPKFHSKCFDRAVTRNEPEGTERKSASARRINVRSPRQGRKRKEPLAARA